MSAQLRPSNRSILCMIGLLVVGGVIGGMFWRHSSQTAKERPWPAIPARSDVLVRPTSPANDYVGGMSCRRCHEQIWERYQSHPMSHSAATISAASPIEDFDRNSSFAVQSDVGTKEYRVERSSDGQFHHESLTDPELGEIYDQSVQVQFAIGSGHMGRSYVLVKDDCLFMSPISWYSQAARWDLSPGYAPENRPRFERRIFRACIVCHVDRVTLDRDHADRFPSPAIIETAISCERCHGPGGRHISFHDRPLAAATDSAMIERDPIVNPAKLDREQREAVCWQCHFPVGERVPRYGRMDSDFRPGMYFDDIWVGFEHEVGSDGDVAKSVDQVNQMKASLCFQRSEGRFSCLSCHDPHFAPSKEEKAAFYREKCMACHADRGCAVSTEERIQVTATDSCVACHMPSREQVEIPHTSQTDHRVLRKPVPDAPSLTTPALTIVSGGKTRLPRIEQERAAGIIFARLAEERRDRVLARTAAQKLASVQRSVPDDDDVMRWLGACESMLGRPESARQWWLEILKQNPRNEMALKRLADISITMKDLPAAREALVGYLEINPWHGDFQVRLAAIYANQGDLDAAVRCANMALKVNPTLAYAHGILAELYQRQGNESAARRHLILSQKLGPLK